MPARQELRWLSGRMKRFQADGAVRQGRGVRTAMTVEDGRLDADAALVAVRMGLFAPHATNSALVAMVLSLVHVVQQDADWAPIETQDDAARGTCLSCVLLRIASHTLDGSHCGPVHRVGFFRIGVAVVPRLVVTEPTAEEFLAARRQQGRFAFVMGAAFVEVHWVNGGR